MNIYVANLPTDTNADSVRKAFEVFGKVTRVNLIKDRDTMELRGFGFIEMPTPNEAKEAIELLNGSSIDGKDIIVNEAKPRTELRNGAVGFSAGRRW